MLTLTLTITPPLPLTLTLTLTLTPNPNQVMAVLCSAVEAAKEPGAKLEVWPSLTHVPGRYRVLYCGVVLTVRTV